VSIPASRRSISASGINPLTWSVEAVRGFGKSPQETEEGTEMKKFGFASIAAAGLFAGVIGFAAPAQADLIHHSWIHEIQPTVSVPQVDTTPQQSR
jgi:hypothetical protein